MSPAMMFHRAVSGVMEGTGLGLGVHLLLPVMIGLVLFAQSSGDRSSCSISFVSGQRLAAASLTQRCSSTNGL